MIFEEAEVGIKAYRAYAGFASTEINPSARLDAWRDAFYAKASEYKDPSVVARIAITGNANLEYDMNAVYHCGMIVSHAWPSKGWTWVDRENKNPALREAFNDQWESIVTGRTKGKTILEACVKAADASLEAFDASMKAAGCYNVTAAPPSSTTPPPPPEPAPPRP